MKRELKVGRVWEGKSSLSVEWMELQDHWVFRAWPTLALHVRISQNVQHGFCHFPILSVSCHTNLHTANARLKHSFNLNTMDQTEVLTTLGFRWFTVSIRHIQIKISQFPAHVRDFWFVTPKNLVSLILDVCELLAVSPKRDVSSKQFTLEAPRR